MCCELWCQKGLVYCYAEKVLGTFMPNESCALSCQKGLVYCDAKWILCTVMPKGSCILSNQTGLVNCHDKIVLCTAMQIEPCKLWCQILLAHILHEYKYSLCESNSKADMPQGIKWAWHDSTFIHG